MAVPSPMSAEAPAGQPPSYPDSWSREGFVGAMAVGIRPNYTPAFNSVSGPHAPHRLTLGDHPTPDLEDPGALPLPILASRDGVVVSFSRRDAPMTYIMRNVEADELHFVQSGTARVETDWGVIDVGPGDFLLLPRSVAYRVIPGDGEYASIIVEAPGALRFDTPAPIGMIFFEQVLRRATIMPPPQDAGRGETTLLLKSFDGITAYRKPGDQLALVTQVAGLSPVVALNLRDVTPVSYGSMGGPPMHFMAGPGQDVLIYTLSARTASMRAPIHQNADYEEVIVYHQGPGSWGAVDEPGTLTWVPKGVTHHGPLEGVPEGYYAWLLEVRGTMRLTPEAREIATLMQTSDYSAHPSAA